MLVLSRKPGEKIQIGPSIAITIVRIGPNTVRIGIDAPRDLNIARTELLEVLPFPAPAEEAAPKPAA